MGHNHVLHGAGMERQDQQPVPPHSQQQGYNHANSRELCDNALGRAERRHHSSGPLPFSALRLLCTGRCAWLSYLHRQSPAFDGKSYLSALHLHYSGKVYGSQTFINIPWGSIKSPLHEGH